MCDLIQLQLIGRNSPCECLSGSQIEDVPFIMIPHQGVARIYSKRLYFHPPILIYAQFKQSSRQLLLALIACSKTQATKAK